MIPTLKIEPVGDVHHLSGQINEHADFSPLKVAKSPLKLDLRRVADISSIGTRRWLTFVKTWGAKPLELYGCPPPFVSLLNSIPNALGLNEERTNVRSVMVPYSCQSCSGYFELEVSCRSLVIRKETVDIPEGKCGSCGDTASLIPNPEDYFAFLLIVDE